jgi:hypothetical protein
MMYSRWLETSIGWGIELRQLSVTPQEAWGRSM